MTDTEIRTWEFLMDGKWRAGSEVVEYVNTGFKDDFILLAGLRTAITTAPRRKIKDEDLLAVYYPGRGEPLEVLDDALDRMIVDGDEYWLEDEDESEGPDTSIKIIRLPDPSDVSGGEPGVCSSGGDSGSASPLDEGDPVVSGTCETVPCCGGVDVKESTLAAGIRGDASEGDEDSPAEQGEGKVG